MSGPWWRGYAPSESWVRCGEADHLVRWQAGRLVTPDHDDVETGGDNGTGGADRPDAPTHVCAQVATAWARHLDDLQVLVLASRGRTDRLAPPATGAPGWAHTVADVRPMALPGGMGVTAYTVVPTSPAPDPLDALLSLGGGLGARLAATVAACWAAWLADGHPRAATARPALAAALTGWATCAVREWLGHRNQAVVVEMIPAGAEPSLTREGSTIVARLPFEWLVLVGLRDATVVLDRFVVGVTEASDYRWIFETVDRTLTDRRTVTLTLT